MSNGQSKGNWTVIAIVALGLILAAVTYGWWSMQGQAQKQRQQQGAVNQQAALEEHNAIAEVFQDAIAENKDTAAVLAKARELVRRYPRMHEARRLLGQVLRVRGHRDEAIAELEESLRLNAQQPNLHEMLGQLEMERGDYDAAAAHFSTASSLEPQETRYRLFLAQVRINQQRYDDARKVLLQTLRINSYEHKAYALLSDMYARQGDLKDNLSLALGQIQKAIENTPIGEREMLVQYYRNKSALLRRANRPREALLTLEALDENERASMAVIGEMATCFGLMGEPENAAALYELAFMNTGAHDYEMLEEAAIWWVRADDLERAERSLKFIQRGNPRSARIESIARQIEAARTGD